MAEKIINDLTRGMIRKGNPLKKEQNFYNFALNLSLDKSKYDRVTKVNENALEDYYRLKNVDYTILNALYLNIDEYVYFITDKNSSFSEIIHYNRGVMTTKYDKLALNFNPRHLITSTYRVSYNGDRIVYFVDGFNKDRVINIDKVSLDDSIESLSINPIYDYSDYLDYNIKYNGGDLKSGKYYIFVQPKDKNGKTSQYKLLIDGIPIENGDYKEEYSKNAIVDPSEIADFKTETNSFLEVHGLPENSVTSKSIVLNLDERLGYYETVDIYVVVEIDTSINVYLREDVVYSKKINIPNLNSFVSLGSDISSVIVDNVIYNKSETLTQKDNRLILSNSRLEGHGINFQSIANSIEVKAITAQELYYSSARDLNKYVVPIPGGQGANWISPSLNNIPDIKNSFSTPYYLAKTQKIELKGKTFMRDEVYALGVYFELDNGVITDVYHIPGRLPNVPALGTDELGRNLSNTPNYDTVSVTEEGQTKEHWQLYNTATTQGHLGYYRCDSVYPDGYGFPTDGQKDSNNKSYIRHHRIPSEYTHPLLNKYNVGYGNNMMSKNIIRLEFSNINIPDELLSVVKNVFFCIADRTESDKKVLSKGIVYSNRVMADGTIRNSEVLNAPNVYKRASKSDSVFEFKSPEVDFKFKNSNIKAALIKPTTYLGGRVLPIVKVQGTKGTTPGIQPEPGVFAVSGSTLNYEGIDRSTVDQSAIIYNYKQELTLNRVDYSESTRLDYARQYALEDNIFLDNNSSTSFAGKSINFEGNQDTSIFKLKNPLLTIGNDCMFGQDDLIPYLPSYFHDETPNSDSSKLYRNFFFNEQENYKNNYSAMERNVSTTSYYDSTLYCTLLSNNEDIFGDLLNITYSKVVNGGRRIQGDCFIDNHFTKKSYSTAVGNDAYIGIQSIYDEKDEVAIYQNVPDDYFGRERNIDLSVSESYISFPVETRYNLRMRRHDGDFNHYPYTVLSSRTPVNELEKKALSQEKYKLEERYLSEKSIKPLFPNFVKTIDLVSSNRRSSHRVIYSELQNNESVSDNFRSFLANNYKDITTTKGDITKVFVKDNKLYIITRDSIFVLQGNNNYLTTNGGNEIYVGSGDFLNAEPDELVSLETGFAGTSSKLSFNENKHGYVFVDSIRNKIILFDRNLEDININGLEEDLTMNLFKAFPNLDDGEDKPLLGYGILSGYDPDTERIYVTKLDYNPTQLLTTELNDNIVYISDGLFYKDDTVIEFSNSDYFENKSFTVTYDPFSKSWISYHDYFPSYYIPHPTILKVKLDDIDIKKYGENYSDKFIIDVHFNEKVGVVKVFDSIQMDLSSFTKNDEHTKDFFDQLVFYTSKQSTGLIDLNPEYPSANVLRKETYWNFNKILDISKDQNVKKLFVDDWNSIKDNYFIDKVVNQDDLDQDKDWFKKARFRDKFINLRLFKNNLENRKFFINFAILNYRQSIR